MPKGRVVFFTDKKGYGFIKPNEGQKDIFVHYTGIVGDGYRTLSKDDLVQFDIVQGPKGEQAANVSRI